MYKCTNQDRELVYRDKGYKPAMVEMMQHHHRTQTKNQYTENQCNKIKKSGKQTKSKKK